MSEIYEFRKLQAENAGKIVEWNKGGMNQSRETQDFLLQWAGRAFVHPITQEQVIEDAKLCYAVFEVIAAKEMIGTIAVLRFNEETGSGYIGHYLLNPKLTGQGRGTEIMKAFIDYCFHTLKLHELTLRVFEYNTPALRCYETNGFRVLERSVTEDGKAVLLMNIKDDLCKMDIEIKRDGLTLRGRLDKKTEGKCKAAILFHGFACDIDVNPDSSYQKITNRLNDCGIAVFRFDFNGHGKSDGNFTNMNIWNEIEDAIAILEYVRAQSFVEEIYLLGHSQGGVIAGMMAGYYADVVSKLVLLAPAVSLITDAQKGKCMMAEYDTNHIPLTVNVDGEHIVGGHYFRIAKTLPVCEVTAQFQGKAAIFIGSADDVISVEEARAYSKCMSNCQFTEIDGIDHGLGGPDQDKLLSEIAQFLQ